MLRLDDYFTVKEAADFLGVSENTIRNWGRDAKIPEHRHPVNNYRLYKRKDLEHVLRQLEVPANTKRRRKSAR